MYIKNKRGQSTVEYVLLVTAVLAVIIAFVSSNGQNSFQGQLNAALNQASTDINSMADTLTSSHSPSAATTVNAGYSVKVAP